MPQEAVLPSICRYHGNLSLTNRRSSAVGGNPAVLGFSGLCLQARRRPVNPNVHRCFLVSACRAQSENTFIPDDPLGLLLLVARVPPQLTAGYAIMQSPPGCSVWGVLAEHAWNSGEGLNCMLGGLHLGLLYIFRLRPTDI